MPRTKVTRNRQVTIPSEIANIVHIAVGDVLDVSIDGQDVVLKKTKNVLPLIKLGKKVTDAQIERLISEAAREISG